MNILASYRWLQDYVDLKDIKPEAFAARVSLSGPGIERLYPQGQELEGVVVGKILAIEPHPQADKLRITKVDVGQKTLTIVCGGSNIAVDQWVPVAMIGARVRWHGEGDLIELKPIEIRGVASEGMICAANEIGLGEAFPHGEREILDLGLALGSSHFKVGESLAACLELADDTVMDIEVTTNRPDAVGMVGLAREAAAILERPFLWKENNKIAAGKAGLGVEVKEQDVCSRFMAVKIDGVNSRPTPWWMKRRLMSAGLRPIHLLADITNYIMLELGQPMHAYDADKLQGDLIVRRAKEGETMLALDGKTYVLPSSALVIADQAAPVAVAGIMGSEPSSVDQETTSVIFEAATFDEVSIRRTARALNLYSDAQVRFEKGLSTQMPPYALARAVELCLELAGGRVTSSVFNHESSAYKPLSFSIHEDDVRSRMGVHVSADEMVSTLARLGFGVSFEKGILKAQVPWWRDHDIESGSDLVEEIARVYGYARIPAIFPFGMAGSSVDPLIAYENKLRQFAKGTGLVEVFTYSFVSRQMLEKAGFDPSVCLRVQNPLSGDFEFMRTSLLPSLLDVVAENQERVKQAAYMEMASVYLPTVEGWSALPQETRELACAYITEDESAWKRAKGFIEAWCDEQGINGVTWKRLEDDAFWHPGRSVQAYIGSALLATVGEVHPTIASAYKFNGRVALVHATLAGLLAYSHPAKTYVPLPQFPEAKRDVAYVVDERVEVQDVMRVLRDSSVYITQLEWFDTYRGKGVNDGKKSVAFHVTFSVLDRTLEAAEVESEMARLTQAVERDFGGFVRGE